MYAYICLHVGYMLQPQRVLLANKFSMPFYIVCLLVLVEDQELAPAAGISC